MSKLFRNNSCQLYVLPTQLIVFPNYSFASHIYAVPMLFSAIRTVSSPKLGFSTPRLVYAVPLAIITVLFHNSSPRLFAFPTLHLSTLSVPFRLFASLCVTVRSLCYSRHFLSPPSPICQASRLSRSCCSRASDSLAVCSSHRGNLYIRC